MYIYILDSHISPYGESVAVQSKSFREKAEPNVFLQKDQRDDQSEEERAKRQRDKETERPRDRGSRLRRPVWWFRAYDEKTLFCKWSFCSRVATPTTFICDKTQCVC
jgi:hypothetical protein